MKAELVIEMEEECTTCPMIELTTHKLDVGSVRKPMYINYHECEHLKFCKAVRENWEEWQKKRVGGQNNE